ncbi:MAG: SIS domain-containing protein [Betaproteobacteria bacterium]|jgi:D-sedoheptulose 7-phosphate isomerase|nr:MAG: SIS domain-containing protein [Betaproteobacteria bacterium]
MSTEGSGLIRSALEEAASGLERLRRNDAALAAIEAAGGVLAKAFIAGNRAYSCGNGGSMCDAMHFAEELTGRFRRDRRPLAALAISDPGHLTCTANDFGYPQIFARFVQAHGRAGDVLLAISTSGSSANVLAAAEAARSLSMPVIALTGRPASPLAELAQVEVCTPAGRFADRVQELHIKVIHVLIELVEHQLNLADAAH